MFLRGLGTNRQSRKWWEMFASGPAKEYVKDPSKAKQLAEDVLQKLQHVRPRGNMKVVWDDLRVLARLIRAWASGEYREVPWQTLLFAVGAAFYFLLPVDAIFDATPILGFLDDAAIIAWVLSSVRGDLEDFREWEKVRAVRPVEAV